MSLYSKVKACFEYLVARCCPLWHARRLRLVRAFFLLFVLWENPRSFLDLYMPIKNGLNVPV